MKRGVWKGVRGGGGGIKESWVRLGGVGLGWFGLDVFIQSKNEALIIKND